MDSVNTYVQSKNGSDRRRLFALRGRGGRFLLECAPSLGRIGLLAGMLCGECSHELGPFVFSPFGGPLAGPAPSDALSLVYRSVFDDQQKVFLRLGQQFDILQRVAVDEQQIGQGVRLDRSERARIGIPAARQGEQLRVVAGYHFQYFVVREPAGQLGDSSVLVLGFGRVEQQVGSPREPDAVLFCELVRVVRAGDDRLVLALLFFVRVGVVVGRERLHAEPYAVVGDHFHRLLVDQVSVLDAFHSGSDRLPDSLGDVNVHHDVCAGVFGRMDRRPDLLLEELDVLEPVVQRGGAASYHQLDLAGAQSQVVSCGDGDGVRTVGDRRRSDHFGVGRIAALERPGNVIDGPEVAVTARLRNHRAAGEYPGAGDDSLVDRALQAEDRSSGVPDRGESPQQCSFGFASGLQLRVGLVGRHQVHRRVRGEKGMPMRVDQSRHQELSLTVDHLGRPVPIRTDRFCRDRSNPVAVDPDASPDGAFFFAVEYDDVVQYDALRFPSGSLRSHGCRSFYAIPYSI